jgi:hypothetical protein
VASQCGGQAKICPSGSKEALSIQTKGAAQMIETAIKIR